MLQSTVSSFGRRLSYYLLTNLSFDQSCLSRIHRSSAFFGEGWAHHGEGWIQLVVANEGLIQFAVVGALNHLRFQNFLR